jgi:MFS transporter, PHS family, inorganic phosphate transporter
MAIKYPQTQGQTSAISSAALAGAIIGQLTFGSLADRLGRRTIFVTTIAIVIIGALGSATVVQSDTINIYTQLTLWLLLLGLGIGGEYPLSE